LVSYSVSIAFFAGASLHLRKDRLSLKTVPEMNAAVANAHLYFQPFAARLKLCPDTKPLRIEPEASFSATCEEDR
jgi:hypothetical protein